MLARQGTHFAARNTKISQCPLSSCPVRQRLLNALIGFELFRRTPKLNIGRERPGLMRLAGAALRYPVFSPSEVRQRGDIGT